MRPDIQEIGEDAFLDDDQKILKRLRKKQSKAEMEAFAAVDLTSVDPEDAFGRA